MEKFWWCRSTMKITNIKRDYSNDINLKNLQNIRIASMTLFEPSLFEASPWGPNHHEMGKNQLWASDGWRFSQIWHNFSACSAMWWVDTLFFLATWQRVWLWEKKVFVPLPPLLLLPISSLSLDADNNDDDEKDDDDDAQNSAPRTHKNRTKVKKSYRLASSAGW